jgi:hypothetical protein
MYATTRYNFVRLKATHKISPLEELVGGSPLSSSQRLTGMVLYEIHRENNPYTCDRVAILQMEICKFLAGDLVS